MNNKFVEIELILLLSQFKINRLQNQRIKELLTHKIDWNYFKKVSIQNRICSIVYKNLKSERSLVDTQTFGEFKNHNLTTGIFSLQSTAFLHKLLLLFKSKNITVLLFKGPVLAEQLYNDLTLRVFSDLDILVNKSDAIFAYQILISKELQPQILFTDEQFKKYIEHEDHFIFFDEKFKITVELHWELSGLYLNKAISYSDLQKHIKSGLLNKITIPFLSNEALLVYLCIHGCKDGWDYLERICCIHEIINSRNSINWQIVYKIATKWQCKRMLCFGLYLSSTIFKTAIPEDFLITDRKLIRISKNIKSNFFLLENRIKKPIRRFSPFHIYIRDSVFDQIQYLLRLLFRPTDKEWSSFFLPAKLSFLQYILRPFRLIILKLRGVTNA